MPERLPVEPTGRLGAGGHRVGEPGEGRPEAEILADATPIEHGVEGAAPGALPPDGSAAEAGRACRAGPDTW